MSTCPSCPLSDTPYESQLDRKRQRLTRELNAYRNFGERAAPPVQPAPDAAGYRNRARMVVRSEADAPAELLGFYQAASRTVVPIARCKAHHRAVQEVLSALRGVLFRYGALRNFAKWVDVRTNAEHAAPAGRDQAIVTLAGTAADSEASELIAHAESFHRDLGGQVDGLDVAVHLNVATRANQSILSGAHHVIAGDDCLTFQLGEDTFRVPPRAFFQINLDQLEALHHRMSDCLPEAPGRLVDLYCGVGAHGIVLAGDDTELLGTDRSERAIDLAAENGRRADVDAQFHAAADTDARTWLEERLMGPGRQANAPFYVIANPARAGMSAEMVATVAHMRPDGVLYVSCEPRTLVRDLDRLVDRGFAVSNLESFDFMPRTDQVETLAVLEPAEDSARPCRERAYQPGAERLDARRFSPGVSGPREVAESIERTHWVGLVAGQTPKHGFLPRARDLNDQGRIEINRLRKVEGNSVVRIEASTLCDRRIRKRFRAWGHPVVGDETFGDRNINHLAARHAYLDRLALHCVRVDAAADAWTAPVPGAFLGLMKLPRKVLDEVLTR